MELQDDDGITAVATSDNDKQEEEEETCHEALARNSGPLPVIGKLQVDAEIFPF